MSYENGFVPRAPQMLGKACAMSLENGFKSSKKQKKNALKIRFNALITNSFKI